MIAADKMMLLWESDDKTGQIIRVKMVDHETNRANAADQRNYLSSRGACDLGWMTTGKVIDTPIGLWAYLATCYGFATDEVKKTALWAFRGVDGQKEWTSLMLRELGDKKITSVESQEEEGEG